MGQGRGGLYSYEWIENALGAQIHNLDRKDRDLRQLKIGDRSRLTPDSYLVSIPGQFYPVEEISPEEALAMLQELPRAPSAAGASRYARCQRAHTAHCPRSDLRAVWRGFLACAAGRVAAPGAGLLRDGARDAARDQTASRGSEE
jgi:hypothetical protein